MHTENTVIMQGDRARIFELASRIEDWPRILPHYREVTVQEQQGDGSRRVVEMAAWRDDFPLPGIRFPVRWRSVQTWDEAKGEIRFIHIGGVALGMAVVWRLTPGSTGEGGVRVTIRHDLQYPLKIMNGWFARDLVGQVFIEHIAGLTLATIKRLVEDEGLNK